MGLKLLCWRSRRLLEVNFGKLLVRIIILLESFVITACEDLPIVDVAQYHIYASVYLLIGRLCDAVRNGLHSIFCWLLRKAYSCQKSVCENSNGFELPFKNCEARGENISLKKYAPIYLKLTFGFLGKDKDTLRAYT